ncbi:MAG TPA: hexitol phosphatase HxpB [Chitinophagaceae bacterium]|nr:hexitol phosphatase HxpB [Chitinophagaceae bacterium]
MQHPIHTVIFDMDGLLINSEPLWGLALNEVFDTLGLQLSPEELLQTTGLRTTEVVQYWYGERNWTGRSVEQVTEEIVDNVTAKIKAEGAAMEGAYGILDFFKGRGFRMGLASSSPMRLIESVLDFLNIRSYFEVLSSGEQEEYGKPHPAVYLSCAARLNSHPLQCLAFEDSINGMIAAKAARMKVVVVPEPHNHNDPRLILADLTLHSLAQFTEAHLQELQ